jgi:dTDP-4-dehydrorhamnose 3,5-epimerase
VFEIHQTELAGVLELEPRVHRDSRGEFVKTWSDALFRDAGLHFTPRETYFTVSAKHVIRGMHFQLPPGEHSKLVCCLQGALLDVVLDLRRSPTYGAHLTRELSADNRRMLLIPPGCAHGFLSLADGTVTSYTVDGPYVPELDFGIAWDSFGYTWPCETPELSQRDETFDPLDEFPSPF